MAEHKAVVSIVVPVYNSAKYLEQCILSVIKQTYPYFELILVDDGSTDQSGEICDRYAAKDRRIKVVHKENGGVSAARNIGIDQAVGDYMVFIDSDDTVDESFLERLHAAGGDDADLVICGFRTFDMNKTMSHHCRDFQGNVTEFLSGIEYYIKNALLQGPCCKLYRTNIIKANQIRFPCDMSFGEDTVFVYEYLFHASQIVSIDLCLYDYNQFESGSLSLRYRADKLDIYIELFHKLSRLLEHYHINLDEGNQAFICCSICEAMVSCGKDLINVRPRLKRSYKLSQINTMLMNQTVKNAFEACRHQSKQYALINKLIAKNRVGMICSFFEAKELIRNHSVFFFQKLKGSCHE